MAPLTGDEKKVIRALRPAVATILRESEADLQREQRLSHTEYVALMFLSEAPDHRLGLSELAARCQQSLSAIGRSIGRLEIDGLVRREQSPHDGRAYNAVLTEAGLARYHQATPVHNGSLRRCLFDHLHGVDLTAVGEALERIATQRAANQKVGRQPARRAPARIS
jgi:DNA-binding MarR family transcriptional regulator